MEEKELRTALLNEPMNNEIPNIEGIEKRVFGCPLNKTWLKTKY